MKSAYYSLMPRDVRYHTELKANAKLIYSEIMACLEQDGVCVKNNSYFSRVLNISKDTASRSLSSLNKHGFINIVIEYEKNTKKFKKRYITPMQNSLYLNGNSKLGYGQNSLEVSANNGNTVEFEQGDPSQNTQSLLFNNNTITKIYTNGNYNNTPVNDEINPKQKDALMEIVNLVYGTQRFRYPSMIDSKWNKDHSLINESINTLYDLIKKDGFEYDVIKDVMVWALDDKFWGKKILSLRVLRKKAVNGFSKFQNMHHNYREQ